jgi:2-oxoglutarate ferredoxin oxidoreductase subunit gamma
MLHKLLFSGSGGQGVLTIGNIFGNAAMLEDLHVTFLPEYGAAMRGGTANCTICVSDEEIASPVASSPDMVLAMNQPSVDSFINKLSSGGKLLYNSSIVDTIPSRKDVDLFTVPASEIAHRLNDPRSTNMIIIGAFTRLADIVSIDKVYQSVDVLMGKKQKVAESIKKAIAEGYDNFPFEN